MVTMKGNKFTRKEHIARALLMGRVYDWRDGTYCPDIRDAANNLMASNMLDCDTLEEIDLTLQGSRITMSVIAVFRWDDYDNAPRQPWEAEDD